MISREIGWSNQNNLTFGIIKQVNKIQKEVCCNCNITTTTTSSSSTSSTSTSTTTSTSSSTTTTTTTLAPALRFTTIIDNPEIQQACFYLQAIGDAGPSVDYFIEWGDGATEAGSLPADGNYYNFAHIYVAGSYTTIITFDTPERITGLSISCND